jgi:hypothetical protein
MGQVGLQVATRPIAVDAAVVAQRRTLTLHTDGFAHARLSTASTIRAVDEIVDALIVASELIGAATVVDNVVVDEPVAGAIFDSGVG